MLLSASDTRGYAIQATDGEVGTLDDLLFEPRSSKVRYLVVDAGNWLVERLLLLAPSAFGALQPESRAIPTTLTKEQVRGSPPIAADRPVSREQEDELHRYYGWLPYWGQPMMPGVAAAHWGVAPLADAGALPEARPEPVEERRQPALRSAKEVIGYYVHASDGDIGHLEDLLVDEHDWAIRYLVIDTRNWLPGRKVIIAPDWLRHVDWSLQRITVDQTREQIKASPEYDPVQTLDRHYQERIYRHYGRPPFWA